MCLEMKQASYDYLDSLFLRALATLCYFQNALQQLIMKINIYMSKLLKCLTSAIKKFDLFPASQYLRYNQQTQYKTAAGGFLSIAIITICIILFYNLGIQTLRQQIIYGLQTKNIQVEPRSSTINFANGSSLMFSIAIQGVSVINTSKKYFNITLRQNFYGPLQRTLINSTTVPLVKCTPQHYSHNEDTTAFYNKFLLSNALCPSMDYKFNCGGRSTSSIYSYFAVYVERCNQTLDASCVSDAEFQAFENSTGGFTLFTPIITTIVNPGDAKYKQTYVEQRNFYFFTSKSGLWINAEIQEYQIDTDISLMPYSDTQGQSIQTIPELFHAKSRQVVNNRFVEIVFSKSTKSTIFTRSFNKIDNYFSYIGGLISTLLLFFFFLSSYSESSFVVSLASEIYRIHDEEQGQVGFNLWDYILINLQQLLKLVHVKPKEGETSKLRRAIKQMEQQLNIKYLLKRIHFCQEAVTSILDEHQIKTIYLKGKKSVYQASQERKQCEKKYKLGQTIIRSNPLQLRQNESSINNIANSQMEQNKKTGNQQRQQELQSQSSLNQPAHHNKCQKCKIQPNQDCCQRAIDTKDIKQSLIHVIKDSNEGNTISQRIIKKIHKKTLPQLGLVVSQRQQQGQKNCIKQQTLQQNFDFQIKQ